MKVIRKITFILVLILFNNISVDAAICDKDNIDKLKEEASKVSITYEMDSEKEKGIYKIIVTGLQEDKSIRIKELNINEPYNEENKGNITLYNIESGIKKVSIYFDICDELLITKTVNIPIFNKYSTREECDGIEDLDVCKEDYQYQLNESIFQNKIKEYKELKQQEEQNKESESSITKIFNNIIEFLKKYYFYIIGVIVIAVSITIYIVIRKKRYTLE